MTLNLGYQATLLKNDFDAIFRYSDESFHRLHLLGRVWSRMDLVVLDQFDQGVLELLQGELHADAVAGALTKAHESQLVSGGVSESWRIEDVGIFWSPDFLVVVQSQDVHGDNQFFGDFDASDHCWVRASTGYDS